MFCCEKCGKEFKSNWQLQRHYSNKRPCETKVPKVASEDLKVASEDPKVASEDPKVASEDLKVACIYCLKVFANKKVFSKHKKNCKESENKIRKLEILLKITPFFPQQDNQCRFCNNIFFSKKNVKRHHNVCKARDDYLKSLEKQLIEQKEKSNKQIINNTTHINVTNNITNNNICINSLGNESSDHINHSTILSIFAKNRNRSEGLYLSSGKSVIDFHKILRENESNKNLLISNVRSQIACVKVQNEFETLDIDDALFESFKNTSKHLYIKMKNEQDETSDELLMVGNMSRNGYNIGEPKENAVIKRQFKVANLI